MAMGRARSRMMCAGGGREDDDGRELLMTFVLVGRVARAGVACGVDFVDQVNGSDP